MDAGRATRNVVVVGSGIAGLSTAYELQKAGFKVTVLEEKHLPGGRMAEEKVGSFMNITGASGLNPWYREMFDLCDELGHGDCLEKLSSFGTGIATDGEVRFPMSNAPTRYELLTSPVLSLRSKLRLASLLPDIGKARRRVDPCLIHTAADFDDESLSEYLTRKVGKDFLEYVVSPLFNVALAYNMEQLSKAVFLARVAHMTERNGYCFKDGIGFLTRTLAGMLDVRLNSRVTRIVRSDNGRGRRIHYDTPDGRESIEADITIMATPGNRVSQIVADKARWERRFFEASVPYCQFGMVTYVLNHEVEEVNGLYFTRDTQTPLNFYKFYPGRSGQGWQAPPSLGQHQGGTAAPLRCGQRREPGGFRDRLHPRAVPGHRQADSRNGRSVQRLHHPGIPNRADPQGARIPGDTGGRAEEHLLRGRLPEQRRNRLLLRHRAADRPPDRRSLAGVTEMAARFPPRCRRNSQADHGITWCPGPDSNRHGVASEGFSYPLRLSPLRPVEAHLWSGLSLCRADVCSG